MGLTELYYCSEIMGIRGRALQLIFSPTFIGDWTCGMEWIAGRGSTRVGRWLIGMGSLQVIDVAAHRNLYKCRCTYELVDGLYLSFDL